MDIFVVEKTRSIITDLIPIDSDNLKNAVFKSKKLMRDSYHLSDKK